MANSSRGRYGVGSSSSSAPNRQDQSATGDFDGDEAADLGQESALLADDPLDDTQERIP